MPNKTKHKASHKSAKAKSAVKKAVAHATEAKATKRPGGASKGQAR